jgi:sodium-independent sulfate anion transporter 11
MTFKESLRQEIRTDETISRSIEYTRKGLRALPKATAEYVLEKVPIIQWLPRYSPRWILNDLIAGITVGVLLVCIHLMTRKKHVNNHEDPTGLGIC